MPRTSVSREKIINFIRVFRQKNGYSPTVREIGQNCGIKSSSVVQYHLNHLEKAGLVTKGREKFRSLSLTGEEREAATVPLLGTIAAGQSIWVPSMDKWNAEAERMVEVPREIIHGRKNVYALQVRGDSMVDAMIADLDTVIMEQAEDIKNGDVVACWLEKEQEVTLKKIFFEDGKIRLQPCNPYMLPMYHDLENVRVQGRVIAVLRINR
jgi:repressor LexA